MFPVIHEIFREFIHKPNKEPPPIVTSKPVSVKDFYSFPSRKKSFATSLAAHLAIAAFLILVAPRIAKRDGGRVVYVPSDYTTLFLPIFSKPGPSMGGGGGGGERSPLPASKGKLPKFDLNKLMPPKATELDRKPLLPEDPAVAVPPEIQIISPDMPRFGNPVAQIGPPSSGPGSGSGIGTGSGGGVGPGAGPGVGPGSGGGVGGGQYRFGGGITAPMPIFKVNPEYSEEARKAKHQGVVELYIEVEPDGTVSRVLVRKSLGLGLDEKAVEAIRQWKFKPGLKEGKPVTVGALVTVTFRLL